MTGIIVTTPPTVELPPGNTSSNPATLPPVTYRYALLNIPQTWTAKQTFPLGMITLNAADITGTLPAAVLPPPSTTTLGGIFSKANVANQWINSIGTDGTPTSTQPAFTNISGSVAATQMPALTGDVTTVAGAVATTLATVNGNVGSFGSATQSPTYTVNGKGLLTAAANVTITPAIGSITGLGTGIATALGVNVGTAGAPVVNGGALGSPSSAGTIPAFTLGGTIAGGGNQINNVIIGTSTPLSGLFTTLSASTSVISPLVIGGTTASSTLTLESTSGAGTTDSMVFKTGSQVTAGTIDTSGKWGIFAAPAGDTRLTIEDGTGLNQIRLRYTGKTGFAGNQISSGNFLWNLTDAANLTMVTNNGSGGQITFHSAGGTSIAATAIDHGLNNLYVQGGIGSGIPISSASTTRTIGAAEGSSIVTSAGTATLTLPAASSIPGRWWHVKTTGGGSVISASSNVVPRAGGAASTAILAATAGTWAILQSDGTNWVVMAGN